MPNASGNFYGLKRFEGSRPMSEQLTASRLNTILDMIDQGVVRFGRGVYGSRLTGGTTLNVRRTRQGQSVSVPFGVSWRVNPSDSTGNTFQAMVNPDSDLLLSVRPNDSYTITGLGTWFPFLATDVICLALTIVIGSGFTVTAATIKSYGQGNTAFNPTLSAWQDNAYIVGASGVQSAANIMLAYSTPDINGRPYLIQSQLQHVLMENADIDGKPAIFDFSHRRRYGITAPGV